MRSQVACRQCVVAPDEDADDAFEGRGGRARHHSRVAQDPRAVTLTALRIDRARYSRPKRTPAERCECPYRPSMMLASPALCKFRDYCFTTAERGRSIVGVRMMACRCSPARQHGASPSFQSAAARSLMLRRESRFPRNSTHATARRTLEKKARRHQQTHLLALFCCRQSCAAATVIERLITRIRGELRAVRR